MKRTLKYALTAVLGAGLILPAIAQDQFPDVPENHWAYEALARMKKEGLLIGYPDGRYNGTRPATRYELAVAMHSVFLRIKESESGLTTQIKALEDKIDKMSGKGGGDTSNFVTKEELQALKDALAALQNDLNTVKGWGDDIGALKKAADTFQKELQSLGVDVEAMKKDLADLNDRVTVLEKKKPAVDIHGDLNLWIGAGNSRDRNAGLTVDGRVVGTDNPLTPGAGGPAGITRDLTILHEGAFTLSGTNDTGPKWRGTIVVGNMLFSPAAGFPTDIAFGNQSQVIGGVGYANGPSDVYINDFQVHFDTKFAGLLLNAKVGRLGYKVSPYLFQRIDNTSYFANERWDNGNQLIDGAVLSAKFGSANLDVFGGKTSQLFSTNRVEIAPVTSGFINGPFAGAAGGMLMIDRVLGANLGLPLGKNGSLNAAYLFLDANVTVQNANRLGVFGADLKYKLGNKLKLSGFYGQSDARNNNTNVNNVDNRAYGGVLSYDGGRLGINAGYRIVEANYLAPGDWGRIGVLRNPTNIIGFHADAHFNVNDRLTIMGGTQMYKGRSNTFAGSTGFATGTNIEGFNAGLKYALNPQWSFDLGYEDTQIKNLAAIPGRAIAGNPRYKWTTLGFGYTFNNSSFLRLGYQISDVVNDYQVSNGGTFKGGFLTTQLTVKF